MREAPGAVPLLTALLLGLVGISGCRFEPVPRADEDAPANGAANGAAEAHLPEVPDLDPSRTADLEPPDEPGPPQPGAGAVDPGEERPVIELEDRFWAGPSTRGVELVGEFVTPEALQATLALDAPVAHLGGRDWFLSDILVSLEREGPGEVATWRVAGPPEVIEAYVERLEGETERPGAIVELGILPLDVRHCCTEDGALSLSP